MYPSCYAHMLNQINYGTDIQSQNNETFETNTKIINCTNSVIDNCVFKFVDGGVLEITGGNNQLRNNYISYVDKTVCNLSSVMTTVDFLEKKYNIKKHNT